MYKFVATILVNH